MLNAQFSGYVSGELKRIAGREGVISQVRSVGGGSINDSFSFLFNGENYFLKINDAAKFPGMFATEAGGLRLLRQEELIVPEVVTHGAYGKDQFLILRYLYRKPEDENFPIFLEKD